MTSDGGSSSRTIQYKKKEKKTGEDAVTHCHTVTITTLHLQLKKKTASLRAVLLEFGPELESNRVFWSIKNGDFVFFSHSINLFHTSVECVGC